MKIKIYLCLFMAAGTMSCGDAAVKDSEGEIPTDTIVKVETQKPKTPHQLELNNGSQWEISRGMRKHFERINTLVNGFDSNNLVDFQILGDDIGKQTSKVIRKCDMKGKAHEELHKWLLPFLDLKEALVMTSSPEGGAAILEHIKSELAIFKTYFK
ncbi:MAG: hypothetical protein AB8B74_03160 [Crocinitomicaceae bacterium]